MKLRGILTFIAFLLLVSTTVGALERIKFSGGKQLLVRRVETQSNGVLVLHLIEGGHIRVPGTAVLERIDVDKEAAMKEWQRFHVTTVPSRRMGVTQFDGNRVREGQTETHREVLPRLHRNRHQIPGLQPRPDRKNPNSLTPDYATPGMGLTTSRSNTNPNAALTRYLATGGTLDHLYGPVTREAFMGSDRRSGHKAPSASKRK